LRSTAIARLLAAALLAMLTVACGRTPSTPPLIEVHRARSGEVEVVLFAPTDALKQTRNYCTLEFRAGADRHLVDVGTVTVQTTMTMQGEPMTGATTDPKRVAIGRYTVEMVLAMTGTWGISIAWDGPEGKGAVTFPADVAGSR
jgi:hypothetical protein